MLPRWHFLKRYIVVLLLQYLNNILRFFGFLTEKRANISVIFTLSCKNIDTLYLIFSFYCCIWSCFVECVSFPTKRLLWLIRAIRYIVKHIELHLSYADNILYIIIWLFFKNMLFHNLCHNLCHYSDFLLVRCFTCQWFI